MWSCATVLVMCELRTSVCSLGYVPVVRVPAVVASRHGSISLVLRNRPPFRRIVTLLSAMPLWAISCRSLWLTWFRCSDEQLGVRQHMLLFDWCNVSGPPASAMLIGLPPVPVMQFEVGPTSAGTLVSGSSRHGAVRPRRCRVASVTSYLRWCVLALLWMNYGGAVLVVPRPRRLLCSGTLVEARQVTPLLMLVQVKPRVLTLKKASVLWNRARPAVWPTWWKDLSLKAVF